MHTAKIAVAVHWDIIYLSVLVTKMVHAWLVLTNMKHSNVVLQIFLILFPTTLVLEALD